MADICPESVPAEMNEQMKKGDCEAVPCKEVDATGDCPPACTEAPADGTTTKAETKNREDVSADTTDDAASQSTGVKRKQDDVNESESTEETKKVKTGDESCAVVTEGAEHCPVIVCEGEEKDEMPNGCPNENNGFTNGKNADHIEPEIVTKTVDDVTESVDEVAASS